jgi:LPS sulfotransferase NodH
MEGVLAFLGVPSPPDPAPEPLELERQADELTEEWVARYLREPA